MNGWLNWETWNVALWIQNDESLYNAAVRYANRALTPSYQEFIESIGYSDSRTPDGADWIHHCLDYQDLNEMISEFVEAKS